MQIQQEKYVTWNGAEYGIQVGINSDNNNGLVTGWFEVFDVDSGGQEFYAEGGLWFEDGITLYDYDGVYGLLPKPVCDLLRELGYDPSYAEDDYTPIETNEHGDAYVVGCAKCGNDVYEVNEKGICNECVNH